MVEKQTTARESRFATFLVFWLGQAVSVVGTGLTGFVLGVWVFQETGSATKFAFISFCTVVPSILLAPIAGALVDRWDRRKLMMLADTGAGLATLGIALLLLFGRLELWHIYVLLAIGSTFNGVQMPAFVASTTLMVPKRLLGQAAGMTQLSQALGFVASPVIAGALLKPVGVGGVILIDFATFLFALATLVWIRIPKPEPAAEDEGTSESLGRSAIFGWHYIRARPGLFWLLILFAVVNFSTAVMQVMITPLVLGFTTPAVLGRVLSTAALGTVVGSVAMSVWGGPRRRIHGILGSFLGYGGLLLLGGLQPSAILIATAGFFLLMLNPIIAASSQAIWQTKVPPALQGRVFAMRRMIAWSAVPVAYLSVGPLTDYVFEPLLAPDGPLASSVGRIIGVGKGRGVAFLFITMGLSIVFSALLAYAYRPLRRVEDELPDAIPDEEAEPIAEQEPEEIRAPASI